MRLKTFALCSSALAGLIAGPAQAQTSVANPTDQTVGTPATPSQAQTDAGSAQTGTPADDAAAADVVVTGFRESLASSRNLKRNAPQQLDAIVAEDIGKLPDLAVSDTAARIPGV